MSKVGVFFNCFALKVAIKSPGRGRAKEILEQVQQAVVRWPEFAAKSGVSDDYIGKIKNAHRLSIVNTVE